MKFPYLCLLTLFIVDTNLDAQCPGSINLCPTDTLEFIDFSPPPSSCQIQGSCAGLETGYLVVSNPDTVVLAGLDSNILVAADFNGCINIVPVCFDIGAVRLFVDALHASSLCCAAVNSFVPEACDLIKAEYASGSEIEGLNDFTKILETISSANPTLRELVRAIELFNSQALLLALACPGVENIAYCLDGEIDFSENGYEVALASCGFADCVDTISLTPSFLALDPHQSIFKANEVILAQGVVTSGNAESLAFQAGIQITLEGNFEVENGAELLLQVEDCEIPAKRSLPGH